MNIYSDIFADMNFLLFEFVEGNNFKILQNSPDWFTGFYPHIIQKNQSIILYDTFPYIEHFMDEMNTQGEKVLQPIVKSSIWSEENKIGREFQLCAYYYNNRNKTYLILENRTPSFNEEHQILQKARDIALVNEQLIQEVTSNQRALQNNIEAHLLNAPDEAFEMIKNSSSAVMVCNNTGNVEMFNQALIDIYKLNEMHMLSRTTLLEQWVLEAEEQYPEIKLILKNGANWEGEFETKDLKGNKKWIRLTIKAVYSDTPPHSHYICIANDIDNYKSSYEGVLDSQTIDYVTKLPNRTLFWTKFNKILKQATLAKEQVALLCIDLDFFKQINNDFGYNSGDFLLKVISDRIGDHVKKIDFIAHLGGDEFAVILRKIKSADEIKVVARRLHNNLNAPIPLGDKSVKITSSMGSVLFPAHGKNEKELMKNADLAMYYAKELGRNQHQFYNKQLKKIKFKIERDKELQDAIENKQFFLEYQPQICLTPSKVFRLEALIRWQHPETGLISPCDFIDSAERSGLIVPIGRWVLHQACAKAKTLLQQNLPTIIAVNVSPKQLKHSEFYKTIKDTLESLKLPAKYLEIEITETAFLDGIENIIPVLTKIRALGVSISLDDFGSGFSSFNYLKQLPLDVLKIDRTFISELEHSEDSRIITTMIIQLAKALKLKVIAEGVESKQQLAFLIEQECDIVQGFYYYRSLSGNQLVDSFREIQNK
jgi:diguanylate cyclase (GGDEF)-like protein